MVAHTFALATEADDDQLRQILRTNPMPGAIALSFEREPNYFAASVLDGPFHQTIVGREGGALVGMAGRSVRRLYVNGAPQAVGYMSQLRLRGDYPWGLAAGRVLSGGWRFYKSLHGDGRAPFYLMSVMEDNAPARRLLMAKLPNFPQLRAFCRLHTYAITVGRRKSEVHLPATVQLQRGDQALLPAIVECLQRNGARRQFSPFWEVETLCQPQHTPGLRPEDFCVVMQGEHVIGCLACWDQSALKQTVVRGYAGAIGCWRWLINLAAPLGGWSRLPAVNTPFRTCFASHLAIDQDDSVLFAALLRAVYRQAKERGCDYLMIGLPASDPLCSLMQRAYRTTTLASQIYLAGWEDSMDAIAQIDQRLPGIEVALL